MPEVTSISIHRNLTNQTRVSNSEANTNREYIYIYVRSYISGLLLDVDCLLPPGSPTLEEQQTRT